MSTVITRPDATLAASSGTLVGGATAHAVLADENAATWIVMAPESGHAAVSMGVPTKPAGSMTKHVKAYIGVASISVNTTKFDFWFDTSPGVTAAGIYGQQIDGTDFEWWGTALVNVGDMTAAQLGDIACGVRRSLTGAVTNLRAIECELHITFAHQPTVAISSVVDGASSSTVTYAHTAGDDGGAQEWRRAWLTNSEGLAVYDTGIQASAATTATADGLGAGTYTWHVQTAQNVNGAQHWSAEDTDTATIATPSTGDLALVDSLVATPDDLQAVVEVVANRDTGEAAWTAVEFFMLHASDVVGAVGEFETGTGGVGDGWEIEEIGSVTGEAYALEAGGVSGQLQHMEGTTGGAGNYLMLRGTTWYPCQPGDTVMATVQMKGGGTARLSIWFSTWAPGEATEIPWGYDEASGTSIGGSLVLAAGWQTLRVDGVAPAGTRSFRVGPHMGSAVAGGLVDLDIDQVRAYATSDDWRQLTQSVATSSDIQTAYDYEARPDVTLHYRARAYEAGGAVGPWVYADPVEWTAEDLWLVPIDDPAARSTFKLAVPPSREKVRREQRLNILGSRLPVFRSDVLLGSEGEFVVITATEAEADQLETIAEHGVVQVHAPAAYRFPSGYYRLGTLQEVHLSRPTAVQHRRWRLPFTEARRP